VSESGVADCPRVRMSFWITFVINLCISFNSSASSVNLLEYLLYTGLPMITRLGSLLKEVSSLVSILVCLL